MRESILQQPDGWTLSTPPVERRRLTTIDAARVLHLSAEGVRNLVRDGKLVAERTLRGQYLFRPDDVLELAAARSRAALTLVRARRRTAPYARGPQQLALQFEPPPQPDFRPHVYGLRSPSETAADRSRKREV